MYHARFQGNHYEIGFRWGSLLAKHGNFILDHIPFPITDERIRFSAKCLPVYQEYFPAVLDEIQGICDGQRCDITPIQSVLFSMYAIPPACCCSCFAVSNRESILLGRNSDFLTEFERSNMNVLYRFQADAYEFTGNTTSFVQMEDGINEHGLAVGLTSVYPRSITPGINAGMMLRFFLEQCRTTQEVIQWAKRLPISSAQTFTVADCSGDIAVIECCSDGLEIIRPTQDHFFVCATNRFHSPALASQNGSGIDDWAAERRYQTLSCALGADAADLKIEGAQDLLAGKRGFVCQYDRKTGRDTVWSVIYDLKNRQIVRAEGNPSRRKFREDPRFSF